MSITGLNSASTGAAGFSYSRSGKAAERGGALLADMAAATGAATHPFGGGAASDIGVPGGRSLAALLSALQLRSVESPSPAPEAPAASGASVNASEAAPTDGASHFANSLSSLLTAVVAGDDAAARSAAVELSARLDHLFGGASPAPGRSGQSFFGDVQTLIDAALAGDSAGARVAASAIIADANADAASAPEKARAKEEAPPPSAPPAGARRSAGAATPFGAALRGVLALYQDAGAPAA
jgi:hypothetical protein